MSTAIAETSYRINCDSLEDSLWPTTRTSRKDRESYFKIFIYHDGIPHIFYPGIGERPNPYFVARVGIYQLSLYCSYGDEVALQRAKTIRAWLMRTLTVPTYPPTSRSILRNEFTYANRPYANRPGWGSMMAQSLIGQIFLRLRPINDIYDDKRIKFTLEAMLTPTSEGGLYTQVSADSIIWEEVANDRSSAVLNGHLVAVWNVEHLLLLLDQSDPLRCKLADLNRQAKNFVVEAAPKIFVAPDRFRYDLNDEMLNTRSADEYATRVLVVGYRWLIDQGYALEPYLDQITGTASAAP